jgi:VCBS repeat-containing protein
MTYATATGMHSFAQMPFNPQDGTWTNNWDATHYWFQPLQDVGEAPGDFGGLLRNGGTALANVNVRLFGEDGTTQIGTTTSDANGHYLFEDLVAGIYVAEFERPDGMRFSQSSESAPDPLTGRVTVALYDDPETLDVDYYDNAAPIAVDDGALAHKNTGIAGSVLANDSDADGDELTVSLNTGASHGTLTLNSDGTYAYAPFTDWTGTDTFTYTIADGYEGSAAATVTITVADTPAPVGEDETYTLTEGDLYVDAEGGVLANDTDQGNGTLTAVLVTGPGHGTLWLGEDGSFYYAPDSDFVGTDTFTYRPTDADGPGEPATVSIAVTNHPPAAAGDEATTDEDTAVTIPVLANDTDEDDDDLTVAGASDGLFGTTEVNPNGTVTYTPGADFNGADVFYYVIDDGHGRLSLASVTVTINPVNDAPAAGDDAVPVAADAPTVIPVLPNDSDVDGDALTVTAVTQGTNGTVDLTGGVVTYTPNSMFTGLDTFTYTVSDGHGGTDSATVTVRVDNHTPDVVNNPLSGTVHAGNAVTLGPSISDPDGDSYTVAITQQPSAGALSYDPGTGEFTYSAPNVITGGSLVVSFSFTVTDAFGAQRGGTGEVTVTNEAPSAEEVSPQTHAGAPVDFSPMLYDMDMDGLAVTITQAPSHGAVEWLGTFRYTPGDPTYVGADTFEYTVDDGHGGVITRTVTVQLTNEGPTAYDLSTAIHAGGGVTLPIAWSDMESDPVEVVSVTQGSHGTVTFSPGGTSVTYASTDPTFNGTDTFTYTISDGHGGTSTATVSIELTNTPPETQEITISLHAGTSATGYPIYFDMDGDSVTLVGYTDGQHGTVSDGPGGSGLTYTATDPTYTGGDSFTYTVDDGHGGTSTGRVNIDLTNTPPSASDLWANTTVDTPVTVTPSYSDMDSDSLTITSFTQPSDGSVSLAANGTDFLYVPPPGFTGTVTFTYTVDDGHGGTATATVTIEVM